MGDTEELVRCGACGLPLNLNESGVRHFGFYAAHSEQRCISLLRDKADQAAKLLEERTRELEESREGESRWLLRVSAIREASGLGAKPMLDELPGEIAKIAARARLVDELVDDLGWMAAFAETRAADDSKTFAKVSRPALRTIAERARSLLSRAREQKG